MNLMYQCSDVKLPPTVVGTTDKTIVPVPAPSVTVVEDGEWNFLGVFQEISEIFNNFSFEFQS